MDERVTDDLRITDVTHSTQLPQEDDTLPLQPYGLPGYEFYMIHCTAICCLACSITASVTVLVYLNYPFNKNLFTRSIGERLVVYLATCDLCFSISHTMDHSYMLAVKGFPPDPICRTFAFFLNEFIVAQPIIVSFTALNAFQMVVRRRKLHLGVYDWRLLSVAFGIPLVFGLFCEGMKWLGPTGAWCYFDMRSPSGPILSNSVGFILLVTLLLNLFCYMGVVAQMRSVELKLKHGQKQTGKNGATTVQVKASEVSAQANSSAATPSATKYYKVARIMMLFVVAFLLQNWAYCVYSLCQVGGGTPPFVIMWAAVFFSNMGGVFNMVAYTLLRKRMNEVKQGPEGDKTAVTNL